MRVLISIPGLGAGAGGAEKTAANLANLLVKDNEVGIIFRKKEKFLKIYNICDKVKFIKSDYLSNNKEKIKKATNEVKNFNPQIIILFYSDISILKQIFFFSQFQEAKISAQECTSPKRMVLNLYNRLNDLIDLKSCFFLRQLIINKLSAIRFTIPEYCDSLIPDLKIKAYGFYNTHNIKDTNFSIKEEVKHNTIISVGGLKNFNKNGLVLAKSFINISHKYPEWKLKFYGVNNFEYEINKIKKYNGGEKIIYEGIEKNLNNIYYNADINVITSFDEGNPNTINESFYFGVPCIGFKDCFGVKNLIKHDYNGLLISREREISNLSDALSKLIEDQNLRKTLSRNSLNWSKINHNVENYKKNWKLFIKKTIVFNSDGIKYLDYNFDNYLKKIFQFIYNINPSDLY